MAEEESIESQIKVAMASRVPYFREQADSLTFEGVRRLLEKDLGLDKFTLDVHKRFVKELLSKYLDGGDEDHTTKTTEEAVEINVSSAGDVAVSSEDHLVVKDVEEPNIEDEGKTKDSPVMGLLKESISNKTGVMAEDIGKTEIPSATKIKEAMRKRAAYFRANSETITMVGVRRLLEKDLELDEFTLDPVKTLIREEVDKIFASKASTQPTGNKKKSVQRKTSKKISSEGSSSSSDNESNDIDEVKPSKKVVQREKVQTSKRLNKRKRPEKETKVSSKKQNKIAKMTSEEVSGDDGGNDSEDGQSHSSEDKPVKKKEVSAPAYGKDVEHLRKIIKSCGMSVPPVVYKKAKQVSDDRRDNFIVKELEKILEKEGLSKRPDEKEIKEVKKRRARAKELEGIDMSNIVLSSRRRSTTSFVPPPKPKKPVESDVDDVEDSDEGSDDDNSDDDNSDGDVDDNDVEQHNDSQNDELDEESEDSD